LEARIVESDFAKIAEGIFGDDTGDADICCSRLQSNGAAHGFTEVEEMAHRLGGQNCIVDQARIVSFHPAVSRHRAIALALGARVHHDNAVAACEHESRVARLAAAIVPDAMQDNHPVAIRLFRAHFPSAKFRAVGR